MQGGTAGLMNQLSAPISSKMHEDSDSSRTPGQYPSNSQLEGWELDDKKLMAGTGGRRNSMRIDLVSMMKASPVPAASSKNVQPPPKKGKGGKGKKGAAKEKPAASSQPPPAKV